MKKTFLLIIALLSLLSLNAQIEKSGLLFDGIDDIAIVPDKYNLNVRKGDFTIEFWMRSDTLDTQYILSKGMSTYHQGGYGIWLSASGNIGYSYITSGGGQTSANSNFNVSDGSCHHIAIVVQAALINFYVDGVFVTSKSLYNLGSNNVNTDSVRIGGEVSNSFYYFNFKGLLKDIRIWNYARDQFAILKYMRKSVPSNASGLVANWSMGGGAKQQIKDLSSNAYHGYKGNTPQQDGHDPLSGMDCFSDTTSFMITVPFSTGFCDGSSVVLNCNVPSGSVCQWYRNGAVISNANSTAYTANVSGIYSVSLTNANGCTSYSEPVKVKKYLDEISGVMFNGSYSISSWHCLNNNSATLSVPFNAGYTYKWYRDSVLVPQTGNSFSTHSYGNYYCVVSAPGGCSKSTSSITLGSNNPVLVPLSTTSPCAGTSVNLEVDLLYKINPLYNWKLNGTSVAITNNSSYSFTQGGVVTCEVTDTNLCPGSRSTNSLSLTFGSLPNLSVNGISSSLDDCDNLYTSFYLMDYNGTVYSDPGVSSITWWDVNSFLPFCNNSTSCFTDYSGVFSASGTSSCGTFNTNSIIIRKTASGTVPPEISSSTTSSCSPWQVWVDYGWVAYQWYFNDIPIAGATTYYFTVNKTGKYTCRLFNSCGSILSDSLNADVYNVSPAITSTKGNVICSNDSTKLMAPYNYSSYQWFKDGVLIPGAISFFKYASLPGKYCCRVSKNGCVTNLFSDTISISRVSPITIMPSAISGDTLVCPGASRFSYSVSQSLSYAYYYWTVPAGATLVSGQGTNHIKLVFSPAFTGGNLKVQFSNVCGSGPAQIKYINSNAALAPAGISGPLSGVCNSTVTYTLPVLNNVLGYTWTVPGGMTLLSGQGTNTIIVNFNAGFVKDTLRCKTITACSVSDDAQWIIQSSPAKPVSMAGPIGVCAGQMGLTYSITPVYSATSYTWTPPSGATITSGQGTTQISMDMGTSSGVLKVRADNACGSSADKSLQLLVVCRTGFSTLADADDFTVFPVPAISSGIIYLSSDLMKENECVFRLFTSEGRLLMRENFNTLSEHYEVQLPELAAGFYICELAVGESRKQQKMIVK
ncbi:MAG: hypothetical protein IPN36_03415 [Bacteroidetes bacterium]|nr:hypothetical protein [Bacteroidota bacterium]